MSKRKTIKGEECKIPFNIEVVEGQINKQEKKQIVLKTKSKLIKNMEVVPYKLDDMDI